MANPDPYSTSGDASDEQKKALLKAMAEQGQAGKQSFEQAQAATQAQKANAVQTALARAQGVNAPDAYMQKAQDTVGAPYDYAAQSLTNQQATFNQDMARQQASAGTYMDQTKAAIPVAQAQSATAIQRLLSDSQQASENTQAGLTENLRSRLAAEQQRQADAASQQAQIAFAGQQHDWATEEHGWNRDSAAAQQAFQLQDRNMQLQIAQQNLANSRQRSTYMSQGGNYAGRGNPLADLVHSLGGTGSAKSQLKTVSDNAIAQHQAAAPLKGVAGNRSVTGERTPYSAFASSTKQQVMDMVGDSLGLQPGELQSYLGKDSPTYEPPKKGPSAKDASEQQKLTSRSTATYGKVAPKIVQRFSELTDKKGDFKLGVTQAKQQMITDIRTDPDYQNHPKVYEQLIVDILAR